MTTRKFTLETMTFMSLFEKITRARVKDCFEDEHSKLTFVVQKGQLKIVLGKDPKANIDKIQRKFNRKIRLLEFDEDPKQFIINCARPIKIDNIEEHEGIFIITPPDHQARGFLIGRSGSILKNNESIVKRYFDIKEIKVQ